MLIIIALTPIIGGVALLSLKEENNNKEIIKIISLIISLITFSMSVIVWIKYDNSGNNYQIGSYTEPGFAHIHLGVDGLSANYILLTGILTPICLLASWKTEEIKKYIIIQLIIEGILIFVFIVVDLLLFYVAFETVLIPLFFMIGLYGSSSNRIRSALLLFLYTLTGSLFILLSIITIYAYTGTIDINAISNVDIDVNIQYTLWIGFFIALAVKTPIVPFHIWLPRAHADAPLAGSIVLAGTVLKIATYGYLRVVLPIIPDASYYCLPIVQSIVIISLIYSSIATIRQTDIKSLVAYSSISHIAIVIIGLFSNTIIGIEGGIILSLAHGLISPAIFILTGGVLYDRFHKRIIEYYRGIAQYIPVFAIIFFIATSANIGVPLSLNWISEFITLSGSFINSPIVGSIGAIGIVLSACYSIWLFGRIISGEYSQHITYTIDINRREIAILIPLIIPTYILGIIPNTFLQTIHSFVCSILYLVLTLFNIYIIIYNNNYR